MRVENVAGNEPRLGDPAGSGIDHAKPRAVSTQADVRLLLGSATALVAIEERWLERASSCVLYCYHLPASTFTSIDEEAGYFVSAHPVTPSHVEEIREPLRAIAERGARVQVLEDLWPLHDAVAASSLQFSMIRMRNARRAGAHHTQPDGQDDRDRS
jgi:hypothetical protein